MLTNLFYRLQLCGLQGETFERRDLPLRVLSARILPNSGLWKAQSDAHGHRGLRSLLARQLRFHLLRYDATESMNFIFFFRNI